MWRIFKEKSNYPDFLHIRMARRPKLIRISGVLLYITISFPLAVSICVIVCTLLNTVHDIRAQLQAHQCTQSLFHLFKKGMVCAGSYPIMNSSSIYMTSWIYQEKCREGKVVPSVTSGVGRRNYEVLHQERGTCAAVKLSKSVLFGRFHPR